MKSVTICARSIATCRPARDTCHANRREGTPHFCINGRNETADAAHREQLGQLEAGQRDESNHQYDANFLPYSHCSPPRTKWLGSSPASFIFLSSSKLIFRALAGAVKPKFTDGTSLPVFQFRIWMLYCGLLAMLLVVTTYRQGYGRSPCASPICQSTSRLPNAR